MDILESVKDVVKEIIMKDAYKVTAYLHENLTVKATRKLYKGGWKKQETMDIVLTVGKPNYEEREKIKRAKKEAKGQPGWAVPMVIKYPPKEKEALMRKLTKAQKELVVIKTKRDNAIRRATL